MPSKHTLPCPLTTLKTYAANPTDNFQFLHAATQVVYAVMQKVVQLSVAVSG